MVKSKKADMAGPHTENGDREVPQACRVRYVQVTKGGGLTDGRATERLVEKAGRMCNEQRKMVRKGPRFEATTSASADRLTRGRGVRVAAVHGELNILPRHNAVLQVAT